MKLKVWSLGVADSKLREWMRNKFNKCVRCGRREMLQVSHFWARGISGTRWFPDNLDLLCYPCHYGNQKGWEYQKQGAYREFKLKQLGQERYKALEKRARGYMSRRDAIVEFMELTKNPAK